jgi:uncharacterized protein (DUF2147 family)
MSKQLGISRVEFRATLPAGRERGCVIADGVRLRNAPRAFAAVFCLAAWPAMAAEPTVLGRWARGDGKAQVRVEHCGSAYCAINTWIRPGTRDEKVGDELVMNVSPSGPSVLSGQAWDPQRNMSYRMTIKVGPRKLATSGCVLGGLVCKHMTWSRMGS